MNHKSYFFDLIKLYFSLNIAYYFFVAPHFSYIGLISNFSLLNFFISIIIIFFYGLIIKINNDFLSSFLKIFFIVVSFIPVLTLFTFNAINSLFVIHWVLFFLFFIILFNTTIKFKSIELLPITPKNVNLLVITFFSSLIYFSIFGLSLNTEYFNFFSSTLYEGREVFDQKMSALGVSRYFFSNFQNVFLPFLLAFGLINKNKSIIIISILFFIYVFLNTTFKSILLTPLLIIGIYIFYNFNKIYLPSFIMKHTYKIILIICFVDYFLIFPFLNTVLIRRIFFLPGLVSEKYHTYFNENGFTYFSDLPFFEFFSSNPFTYSIPETIGRYFIYEEGYMNANFLADAYSKLGLLSVILYLIILKLLISFSESSRNNKEDFIIFSLVVTPFIALSNSSLTTTLFSHGLLLSLFVSSQIKKA